MKSDFDLRLSPNPFNQVLNISFNANDGGYCNVNLYDSKGALVNKVYSGTINKGVQQKTLNGKGLSNGIYYLELTLNSECVMRKILLCR